MTAPGQSPAERPSGAAGRALRRRRERVEAAIGFLGFFVALTVIAAVVRIVRGEPSSWASLLLVVLLGLLVWAVRVRRRIIG